MEESTALIILNTPISHYDYYYRLHTHAAFRLCADGAANRVHDLALEHFPGVEWTEALRHAPPDVVHGDLDSLDHRVQRRYEHIGVEISRDPDQYSTDFEKSVKKVVERLPDVQDLLVLGGIGGRIDQGIGLLAELYREQKRSHPGVQFWLFSEASVSALLLPGTTRIHTPLDKGLITRNIGILPLYGPARIGIHGCEWDVQSWPTEMGGQMSTSNHIVADCITITTDREVLFTVERQVDG